MNLQRRPLLLLLGSLTLLAGCASTPPAEPSAPPQQQPIPIVFVHGNGDSAAQWQTMVWRFESQGWPRERLHAVNQPDATNARLDKAGAKKLAQMSHDGLARTINPVHTVSDGDVMFALSTSSADAPAGDLRLLGPLAAEVTARAVLRAIRAARGLPGLPAAHELETRKQ